LAEDTDKNTHTDAETVLAGSRRDGRESHDACLVIIRGARLGSRIVLGHKPVVIGRSIEADFQISERSISRSHCRIFRDDGRYWLEDLQSTNNTFLNEE
jgi:pSer/pThr/pTyr-binding forkhead associated (FHA) protein